VSVRAACPVAERCVCEYSRSNRGGRVKNGGLRCASLSGRCFAASLHARVTFGRSGAHISVCGVKTGLLDAPFSMSTCSVCHPPSAFLYGDVFGLLPRFDISVWRSLAPLPAPKVIGEEDK
jgi:hypothetical protein